MRGFTFMRAAFFASGAQSQLNPYFMRLSDHGPFFRGSRVTEKAGNIDPRPNNNIDDLSPRP
jgi:hypothetical protein